MQRAIVAGAALIVFACALPPVVALATQGGAFAILASPRIWQLFGTTLATAFAVTGVAVAIGVPLGVLLSRTNIVLRRALLIVHAFPMFVPPFLLALGWSHIAPSSLLFSRAGLVFVLALAYTPIVTALTVLGLDGIDPALDDAARIVASPRRVIARILLPVAWPSIVLAALVVFALAFAELAVPMFLRVDAYPAAVFARLGGIAYAPGEAFVLVLPQLAVAAALLVVEHRWVAPRAFNVLGLRRGHMPYALGRWRAPTTLACTVVGLVGVVPLGALATHADWTNIAMWAGESVGNSLVDAAIAATIMTSCGIVLGHAIARGVRGGRLIDALLVLAFFVPSAALGAGLIHVWSRPATQIVYATSAIIVVGYVARYAVLGARPLAHVFARGSARLEEAAATSGAGYLRRLVGIVVRVHVRAIGGVWLLSAVFCLRDLETAVVYYPPGRETLPVRIFTVEANGPPGTVAALAIVHVAIIAAVLAFGFALLRRRSK